LPSGRWQGDGGGGPGDHLDQVYREHRRRAPSRSTAVAANTNSYGQRCQPPRQDLQRPQHRVLPPFVGAQPDGSRRCFICPPLASAMPGSTDRTRAQAHKPTICISTAATTTWPGCHTDILRCQPGCAQAPLCHSSVCCRCSVSVTEAKSPTDFSPTRRTVYVSALLALLLSLDTRRG
jgi:hypothetical protein